MTDQEREIDRVIKYIRSCRKAGIDTNITIDKRRNHFILNALEEVLQYRSIGTVEEFSKAIENVKTLSRMHEKLSDKEVSEYHALQEYEKIGTVEECREAVERQREKKPNLCMNEKSGMFVDYADGRGEYKAQMNNWWRCPCCNEVVGQRVIVHKHIHDQRKKKYCENCGQAIDWRGIK